MDTNAIVNDIVLVIVVVAIVVAVVVIAVAIVVIEVWEVMTLPPAPSTAEPDLSVIDPLLPADVVPDVKLNAPETPAPPAFVDLRLKAPLDFALPYPVIIDTAPPVFAVASPALIATRPPAEIAPLPT